mgnify:CR=1 FL=1
MRIQLDPDVLEAIFTDDGSDLRALCEGKPMMLVFLRHFGCTFCREAMSDIAAHRSEIEQHGVEVILVHQAEADVAKEYLQRYELSNMRHISDPDRSLYEYFGLMKGSFWQLYGLKTWLRGIKAGLIDGHGRPQIDKKLGNYEQMPGVFIIYGNRIRARFLHQSAADRPDYVALAAGYAANSAAKNNSNTTNPKI